MAKLSFDLEADIQPASDFRDKAASMLKQVRETGRPLLLTRHGRGAAVLLDVRTYQALLDELSLLRDVGKGEIDVEAGRVVGHEQAHSSLRERYGTGK